VHQDGENFAKFIAIIAEHLRRQRIRLQRIVSEAGLPVQPEAPRPSVHAGTVMQRPLFRSLLKEQFRLQASQAVRLRQKLQRQSAREVPK